MSSSIPQQPGNNISNNNITGEHEFGFDGQPDLNQHNNSGFINQQPLDNEGEAYDFDAQNNGFQNVQPLGPNYISGGMEEQPFELATNPLPLPNQNFPPVNQQLSQSPLRPEDKNQNERKSLLGQQNQPQRQLNNMINNNDDDVRKWKNINLIIVILTVFMTIIFLQVLAFAQNAVPQTNNIAISSAVSIVYFILSFATLFFLFLQYEVVNYSYKDVLACWRFLSAVYGLAILVLGIIELAIEFSQMESKVDTIWATLSSNQKLYFYDSRDNLVKERTKNVAMVGAFSIIVGAFIIVSGVTTHLLYQKAAVRGKPVSKSRLPVIEQHEQVDFNYLNQKDEEDLQHEEESQDKTNRDQELNEREDEDEKEMLVQKERMEIQQNALQMKFGAIPGQGQHDEYANYGTGYGTGYGQQQQQHFGYGQQQPGYFNAANQNFGGTLGGGISGQDNYLGGAGDNYFRQSIGGGNQMYGSQYENNQFNQGYNPGQNLGQGIY